MQNPLTLTVITDTHYYSKRVGTGGSAYDKANAKSQKLLAGAEELLKAAFTQIKNDKRTDIVLLSATPQTRASFTLTKSLSKCSATLKTAAKGFMC